jgi:aldehyde dehydrogenase (NAD+)
VGTVADSQETGHRWVGERVSTSCFIDGGWVDGEGEDLEVISPVDESTLATVQTATRAQLQAAVSAARAAFDHGPWATTSPADRSRLLHRLCDLFEARQEAFISDIISETGSPISLTRFGQVGSALECLRWFADAAKNGPTGGYERGLALHHQPFTTASLLRHEPAGVVGSITAYNYPLVLLARKLGGVLASGCTTVLMPSPRTPLATLRFFEMLEEVGYPPGVANYVVGGKDVAQALTLDPRVDMITFTGSVAVGREVMRQAAGTTKRVVLELGGKSPTIILDGADVAAAVGPSVIRFTLHAGQGCGCTTRTLVAREHLEEYSERAQQFVAGLQVGDPWQEQTNLGPLIRPEHRASVEGYVERALSDGATVFAGGGRPDIERGFYMNPTYVTGVDNDAEISQNELFGPVGILMPFDTVSEAVEIANSSRYGLYASVWGRTSEAMDVARRLSSGTVALNGGGTLRPDIPWGGYRDSGNGREAGEDGFREFFEVKHIQWPL